MTIKYKRTFASVLFVLISFLCFGQPDPPPPPGPPPTGFPIDGGIAVGVIFALLYGGKKIKDKK